VFVDTHRYDAQYIEFLAEVKAKGQTRIVKVAQSRVFDVIRTPRIDYA